MIQTRLLATFLVGGLAAAASAQIGPLHLVDASGTPLGAPNGVITSFSEDVYLAFEPSLHVGVVRTYYVHVTDGGITEVLSANDPSERIVQVVNNAGVISLSFPFHANPDPQVFGLGLNGVGQSLRLSPLDNSAATPCEFKAQVGDTWDLQYGAEFPYIIRGTRPDGTPADFNFEFFRIGDGSGTDIRGEVFLDTNENQVRDPGEGPAVGWTVTLSANGILTPTVTDANGAYFFPNVGAGSYTLLLTVQAGYSATTTSSQTAEVNTCADVVVGSFGVAPMVNTGNCDGHTIGYWRNVHGLGLVTQLNILSTLGSLNLRDAAGNLYVPATNAQFKSYLKNANAVNMAYMLSAQLLAMHCNVLAGFVDPACAVTDPNLATLGLPTTLTIMALMQEAIQSLGQYGNTFVGHPERNAQQILKNALDDANNNRNWL